VTGAITATGAITGGSFTTAGNITTSSGKVGIGTTTPSDYLSVEGGGQVETASTSTAVAHFGSADVHTYFGSYNVNGSYAPWLQAMRKSDSTSFPMAINPNGGNVGIGTKTPSARLDVNGDIKSSGKSVPVTEEANLRIIRGTVDSNGTVLTGNGTFTVVPVAGQTGLYHITFTTPFSGTPTVTTTATGRFGVRVDVYPAASGWPSNGSANLLPSAGGFTAGVLDVQSVSAIAFGFQFIAIGPR